ncbi:chitobiase/beta-hexosaminidase C-terminal domain-containing protein [Acetobacterium malicum]|uniref:chitobiase/beta-hexosaminidase C-terminal domain-containing protein n=1 Tax=Acetobacterium malicum TaxID=52692 RepID=UPI00359328D7
MKDSEFCPKCGAKLEPGEPFCGNCGFDTESTDNAMLVPQDPIQPVPMVSAQIPGPPKTSSSGSQKTAIIILSVLLGVVVLISGATFLWFSLGSRLISNSTNTAANHSTQGSTGEKQVTIELPSYSLNEGSYTSSQKVEINKPAGEEIVVYFTIDGTDPTDKSSRYDSAIVLNTTTTLKSIAIDKNGNKSGIKTGSYTITIPQQATTQQPAATTTPAVTVEPEVSEWQQFENNISGTWQWTDGSGFTLYYQFSNGMLLVTDGGSDYYYDYYSSTVTTGTNGTIGTVYTGGDQLYIDCNPLGDNAIYINGYLCTYAP